MISFPRRRFSGVQAFYGVAIILFLAATFSCSGAPMTETGETVLSAALALQSGDIARPESIWPHDDSDLKPDPAVRYGRLANGVRYVVMANKEPLDRVSMHLDVQAGSFQERDGQQGYAHYLEHMLFNGSEHFKPGELIKYFQRIGMQFGADANAHTGFRETVYDILLPDGSRKSLEEGLLVLKDYAEGALLLESEVERERGIILAEKQMRDSASYRTFVSSFEFELPEARASRRLPIGLEETIRQADRKQLKEFYDTWYRPEKMVVVVVGDVDVDTTAELIDAQFGRLIQRGTSQEDPDFGKIEHSGVKAFYHHENEAGATSVSLEVFSLVPRAKDSLAYRKDQISKDIANSIVQDRLDKLLRKENAPFTSVSIGSGIFLDRIAYAEISAESDPGHWETALGVLERTLRQACKYGFSEAELEKARKEYIADLETGVQKAQTRESQVLSRQIIRALNEQRVLLSPEQEKNYFTPILRGLTVADIDSAFCDTWKPDHRLLLVTGNTDLDGQDIPPAAIIAAAYDKSRKAGVKRPAEIAMATFPYFASSTVTGTVERRTELPDLGITTIDFSNGVRLNLKKTDFKESEVQASIIFGDGRFGEPENLPGLAMLAEGVVNESGLGPLTREELDYALAGKKTGVGFAVDMTHFRLHGTSVPEEIDLMFQLFFAYLTDPAFRPEAARLTQERLIKQYHEMANSIDGGMEIAGERFLAGGDSRFGFPSADQLRNLTLDAVKTWIDPALRNARIEVSVIGDFEPEQVIAEAARYIGSLPTRSGMERKQSDRLVFPAGEKEYVRVPTEIVKSRVVVAYPTDDFWDISRTRRLSVLGSVFSERLREEIREKMGVAYSAYAYNSSSRAFDGYGVLRAVVPTDPAVVEAVVREIRAIGIEIADGNISEDELRRSLDPILTSLKDMRRTNNYWLRSVMTGSSRHPEQFDWARTILVDYGAISLADIKETARAYLVDAKAAAVVISPEIR